jgi:hypothetical protein
VKNLILSILLLSGCATSAPAPLECAPRPVQAIYANVHGWAYYNCPVGALPADDAQCAHFREATNDPDRPATWACDRPGNGSVLLAAISEASAP